jgi:hypothetical protein
MWVNEKKNLHKRKFMERLDDAEGRYRVLLLGIGDNTEAKREFFCKKISEIYGISLPLLRKIVGQYPSVLKKNLTLNKAITLARTLKSFGALLSIEERRDSSAVSLEFQEMEPHQLALESSYLKRAPSGTWNVIGRIRNISGKDLNDIWALIQLYDHYENFLYFEEVPIPINPLPPNAACPFKAVLEGDLPLKTVSIAFKNSSGTPIPAVDRGEKKEWTAVKWETKDEEEGISSSPFPSVEEGGAPSMNQSSLPSELFQPSEVSTFSPPPEEAYSKVPGEEEKIPEGNLPGNNLLFSDEETRPEKGPQPITTVESEMSLPMTEDIQKFVALGGEATSNGNRNLAISDEAIFPGKEPGRAEKSEELTLNVDRIEPRKEEVEESVPESEPSSSVSNFLHDQEETMRRAVDVTKPEPSATQRKDMFQEARFDFSIFEEASKLLEEISQEPLKREKEEPPPYPWIEDFKNSVEAFYQKTNDAFCSWFISCRNSEGLDNPYHSLLTILTHARFVQKDQTEKAFENTQKVFKLLPQSDLRLEEIPFLEGTLFFTGENWTVLFHRAVPKLRQVANNILERKKWNAPDLERLIQVIPHMSDKNSHLAIRWIQELIPDVVEIDSSMITVSVGESLYRVGSRLGVVDPHFDPYQGKNSIGDVKIQAFGRMAFPQSPWKIEEPMAWLGLEKEQGGGGHCLPTQPYCEGCLFETFCSKLYPDLNPSEKGMRT